jgi:crossover junction endodeoxyribonuclease RuvC
MKILGIDPGTARMGFGVIEVDGGSIKLIDYGCINTHQRDQMADRLVEIYGDLQKIIKEYQPNLVAIENLFFFNNQKTAISVSQARGVAVLAARLAKLPIHEPTPLQVKQAVACYGKADKAQVQQMVKTLLKLDKIPKPDDAADALAIAICAANSSTNSSTNVRI